MEGLMLGDGVVLNSRFAYIGPDRKQVIEPGTPGTVIGCSRRKALVQFEGHIPVYVQPRMLNLVDGDGTRVFRGFSWDYYALLARAEHEAAPIEEGVAL
jgi:hypothetical protein